MISVLTLLLFRLRTFLGLAPLYVALGSFQFFQLALAPSLFVRVTDLGPVNPASILFVATLFSLLIVYIWEETAEARRLVYGISIANVSIGLISAMFGLHLILPGHINLMDLPQEFFFHNFRILIVGTLVVIVDVFLIILAFEWISRFIPHHVFWRITLSLGAVLCFDAVMFTLGSFGLNPNGFSKVIPSVLMKLGAAIPFAMALTLYLRFVEHPNLEIRDSHQPIDGVFRFLTYRQKYEEARRRSYTDPLTGLFNRGYFDKSLPVELERSRRSGLPVSLLLADLDHFKEINDTYGHPAGDQVLREVARVLRQCARSIDVVCRIGGDEFAIILNQVDLNTATRLSQRLSGELKRRTRNARGPFAEEVSATIGLAAFPDEAATPEELVALADQRLYQGKHTERGKVMTPSNAGLASTMPDHVAS